MLTPSVSIYDASAGAGKTHTLVKEYLKIVLQSDRNDAYKNILAITFTNKAVNEMKSRVVETLFEFSKANPSNKALGMLEQIAEEIHIPTQQLQKKAGEVIRHLIHNYASFDISTIDKFTHRVIRTFARDLDLPSSFEVSLDSSTLLTEAVDALIAQAGEQEDLTQLLIDFTLEKADDDRSWDVSRDIYSKGELLFNELHRQEVEKFQDKDIAQFIALKKQLREGLKEATQKAVDLAKECLSLIASRGIETTSFYSSYVPKHFQKIASGDVIKHTGHYKYLNGEKNRYSAKVSPDQKAAIDEIALQLLDLYQEINREASKCLLYGAYLKNITPLSVLNSVGKEIDQIQKEQNILSISEFNSIIHNEIQGQPAPFIYERMGERYRHFFIDEFQDTSEMQWQNLVPLIDNALSGQDDFGQKGTLMLVGDPKQSIYRWRGGKAEQFIDIAKGNLPFSTQDWQVKSLDTNWRSYSQIIEFNNEFFGFLSDKFENPDYRDLYKNKSAQKVANKKGGYVHVSFVDTEEDKDEVYCRAVLNRIQKLLAEGFKLQEIAILTRTRDEGIQIAAFLNANEIPIISSETLRIDASSSVRFLVALLRYLYQPNDLESKAKWLYYLGEQKNIPVIADFIAEGLEQRNDLQLGKWLAQWDVELSFSDLRKKSLYEVSEFLASQLIPGNDAYVQYFLDVVLEREIQYQSGIGNFLQFWEEQSAKYSVPSPEGADAVRIMTIHKSKGLEFPVVIYPYVDRKLGDSRDQVWIPSDNSIEGLPNLLVHVGSGMTEMGDEAATVYQQKTQEQLLDTINVLYVALTRAEEQLYVIATDRVIAKGKVASGNLASFFAEFLDSKGMFEESLRTYEFGHPQKVSPLAQSPQPISKVQNVEHPLQMEQIKIAQKEALMWGSHQMEAIEYGNTLHEILSQIQVVEDLDSVLEMAERTGLINPVVTELTRKTILEILEHEELKPFFDPNHTIYREQTLISPADRTLKPDRVAISEEGNAYILDYKTGAPEEKHRLQVLEYASALEEMGFSVVKKMLLYTGSPLKILAL